MARVMVNPEVHHAIEPDLAGVPLGEGVGRNESQRPVTIQQGEGAQEEVGDEIGAAPSPLSKDIHEPVANVLAHGAGELLPAQEGRVADNRVETSAFHDLGDG